MGVSFRSADFDGSQPDDSGQQQQKYEEKESKQQRSSQPTANQTYTQYNSTGANTNRGNYNANMNTNSNVNSSSHTNPTQGDEMYDTDYERNLYYQDYYNNKRQAGGNQSNYNANGAGYGTNRKTKSYSPPANRPRNRIGTAMSRVRTAASRVRLPKPKVIVPIVAAVVVLIVLGLFNGGSSGKSTLRAFISKALTFDNFCWLVIIIVCFVIMRKFYNSNRRR